MVINTNTAATNAAYNLGKNYADHERNLTRLSTGLRINSSYDDAAGLAVSMKMDSQIRNLGALDKNLSNAKSFLETQDGALRVLAKILTRIQELEALKKDISKNAADLQNYALEINVLREEIVKIREEKFNGIRLFSETDTPDYIEASTTTLDGGMIKLWRPAIGNLTTELRTYRRAMGSQDNSTLDTDCLSPVALDYLFNRGNSLVNSLGSVAGIAGSASFGENTLHRNDDESSSVIDITPVFGPGGVNFNGVNYTTIYVNNNGNITFGSPLGSFTPSQISAGSIPIIAPFWADVDTNEPPSNPGPTPGGNSTGSNRVYWDLDTANGVLTVTWDDVRFYPNGSPGTNPNNVANSFQLQLMQNCDGDATILFRYENVDWTAGQASGGNILGLGGMTARAGFNNGAEALELPQSGNQEQILNLDSTLPTTGYNSNQPGVYIFQLRNGQINPPLYEDVTETITTVQPNITLEQAINYIAQNGATQSAVNTAIDRTKTNVLNLTSAKSRILDVDIAQTTSDLAKTRILIDAGTAMSAQANSSQQSILKLLDSTRN